MWVSPLWLFKYYSNNITFAKRGKVYGFTKDRIYYFRTSHKALTITIRTSAVGTAFWRAVGNSDSCGVSNEGDCNLEVVGLSSLEHGVLGGVLYYKFSGVPLLPHHHQVKIVGSTGMLLVCCEYLHLIRCVRSVCVCMCVCVCVCVCEECVHVCVCVCVCACCVTSVCRKRRSV